MKNNYYKEFANKANELGMNVNDSTQLQFISQNVSSECYNYLKFQISQHGINYVFRKIKTQLSN